MATAGKRLADARLRLLRQGPDAARDGELLGLWLGLPVIASGDTLLRELGGPDGLAAIIGTVVLNPSAASRLLEQKGVGHVSAARLLAAVALIERQLLEEVSKAAVLSCSSTVRRFLRHKLSRLPREVFACLFLDSRHRLICYEVLFLGTVDRASVHPREVLRRSLELNAAALVLAHNHPSGIAEPSASDVSLTRDLRELLARIDVRVLDHLVVGRGSEVSFAERGLL